MKTTLVRYKTRQGKASENEALIHAVFDELRSTAPAGFRYRVFKLDDGESFVHFAMIDTADGNNPLTTMDSFRRFQANIKERCIDAPVAVHMTGAVDSFGFD